MKYSPLSGEKAEPVFRRGSERLTSLGNTLTEPQRLAVFHRVVNGTNYVTPRYLKWWGSLKKPVDVGQDHCDLLSLVLDGFGLPGDKLTVIEARENAFMLMSHDDEAEKQAINVFSDEVIVEFQNDPVLRLAS